MFARCWFILNQSKLGVNLTRRMFRNPIIPLGEEGQATSFYFGKTAIAACKAQSRRWRIMFLNLVLSKVSEKKSLTCSGFVPHIQSEVCPLRAFGALTCGRGLSSQVSSHWITRRIPLLTCGSINSRGDLCIHWSNENQRYNKILIPARNRPDSSPGPSSSINQRRLGAKYARTYILHITQTKQRKKKKPSPWHQHNKQGWKNTSKYKHGAGVGVRWSEMKAVDCWRALFIKSGAYCMWHTAASPRLHWGAKNGNEMDHYA